MEIRANPHPGQITVHNSPARFKILSAGRRWGKTRLGVMECLDVAAHGGRAWWIAPSYKISEVGWRPLSRMAKRIPGADVRLSDREVNLPGGGAVAVRSADSQGGLRGEGLDFVVFDECAFMREEAWTEEIRPALSDRLGKALFISTPKGRNWFWNIYTRGQSGDSEWKSFQFKTSDNPFIAPSEVEAAKADLPELVYLQEYEAQFVDMEGSVFRRIQDAIYGEPLEAPIDGAQYVTGVDVAASVDYTVVSVMDIASKTMVYQDRFNRVDYNVLEDRLQALYNRWRITNMVIEANSIGQPVLDHLYGRGMSITPFTTSNVTKQGIITALQSAFEHGEIRIANYPVMVSELLSFESKRNASGSFSYSAPEGMHDDCVMSLALAWYACGHDNWLVS